MCKRTLVCILIAMASIFLTNCEMGHSTYMTKAHSQQLQKTFSSMQENYDRLLEEYKATSDSLPRELRILYARVQEMHTQMQQNHRQMMARNKRQHRENNNRMMSGKMAMHMQAHKTGEWYRQMKIFHEKIAALHGAKKQQTMAEMNSEIAAKFGQMIRRVPGLDRPTDVPFNEQASPSVLNGEKLFVNNCASCHGTNGTGIANVFPPVVDTEWITGNKSVPIRILLHGMHGKIEVSGRQYDGNMPSFKARLSAAEMVAILNYLRSESEGKYSKITQDDVISIGRSYGDRTAPWSADELMGSE